jgi:hypothetical protein
MRTPNLLIRVGGGLTCCWLSTVQGPAITTTLTPM